jgi:hypothetical protein
MHVTAETVPEVRPAALTIEAVEVTPIVVPLAQEYRGSYYHMTNRTTVVTRVVTREGVVGEAYAGDEDSTLLEIAAVVTDEIAPRLIGEDGFAIERRWELGSAWSPSRRSTRSGRRWAGRCGSCGAATATRSRSTSSAATTAATWPGSATRSQNGSSAASAAASSRSAAASRARTQNESPPPGTPPATGS